MFSRGEATTRTTPPMRSTSDASSVAAASTSSDTASARSKAARRKTCGVCTAHSTERSSVRTTSPPGASLIVSVTGAAAITASQPNSTSASSADAKIAGVTSARAASWTITGSPSPARSALSTECDRCAPPTTPIVPAGADAPCGSATTICSTPATARSASMLHSSIGRPATTTNALGPSVPRRSPFPAAKTSASATWPPRRRSRRAGRRGAARPRPRPCRARTSARMRGSSSPA